MEQPTRTLSVRVPETLWQRCEAARDKNESWAEVIRQALAAWERGRTETTEEVRG